MGVRPLAEHRRVGDEPAVLVPHMELIAGRFVHEPQRRLSGEVKEKLGPRAWGGAGDRPSKTAVDRAVQMAAEDALNLGIADYDRGERLGVLWTVSVHPLDARHKGGWCIISRTGRAAAEASA